MKKLVRTLIVSFLIFATANAFAQSVRIGAVAGLQLSRPEHVDSKLGFNLGAKGEFDFSDKDSHPYLDFSLLLSAKGWKEKICDVTVEPTVDWICRLYYLEMPVHIGYTHTFNERFKLLADIGPYVAVGLTGKTEVDGVKKEDKYESNNLFNDGTYKRFDVGAGAKVGIETNGRFQIMIGYEMSFINQCRWKIEPRKDRTFGISVAYMFL